MTFAIAALSCATGDPYILPDGDKYDGLYLVQAASGTQVVNLLSSQDTWSSQFNAFYSSLSSPSDINMTFTIDNSLIEKYNEEHASSYIALPDGACTLSSGSATIKAGQFRTGLIDIKLEGIGDLPIDTDYLLPIKMRTSSKNIKVNEKLDALYFAFRVNKDRSPVLLDGKVDECDEFFNFHDKCILTRNRTTGALVRYEYDHDAKTIGNAKTLYTDWVDPTIRWIQAGNGNTLQLVNSAYTWFVVDCNEDASVVGNIAAPSAVITGGCNIFMDSMICEAPLDGYINIWSGSGNVAYYQLTADGHGLTGVIAHTNPGDGANIATDYRLRFMYKGDLFCIDPAGNLWKYAWNKTAFKGRTQIGSGWGKFTNVTCYGDDFLMRLSDGSVMMIEFEPDVFWAFNE